jgi:hypothetical protein
MLLTIIKGTLLLLLIGFVWVMYIKFVRPLMERSRLMKQGVVYLESPIISEIKCFKSAVFDNPYAPSI